MENNVGKRILEVRNKRNLTQEELAEKVGSVTKLYIKHRKKKQMPIIIVIKKNSKGIRYVL